MADMAFSSSTNRPNLSIPKRHMKPCAKVFPNPWRKRLYHWPRLRLRFVAEGATYDRDIYPYPGAIESFVYVWERTTQRSGNAGRVEGVY